MDFAQAQPPRTQRSTYILDQKTRHDTKVEECINLISDIVSTEGEKVVVFSQWERMTRLIAAELKELGIGFEYLHGGVPSAKRKDLVDNFMLKSDCRVFLTTDTGSTGLNLQAAATLINIDIPWNPAVLEQRIGRIYRLGQQRNIQVINLVTPHSIEQEMLGKLRFKTSMFEGALDDGADSVFVEKNKFAKMMKSIGDMVDEQVSPPQPALLKRKARPFPRKRRKRSSTPHPNLLSRNSRQTPFRLETLRMKTSLKTTSSSILPPMTLTRKTLRMVKRWKPSPTAIRTPIAPSITTRPTHRNWCRKEYLSSLALQKP